MPDQVSGALRHLGGVFRDIGAQAAESKSRRAQEKLGMARLRMEGKQRQSAADVKLAEAEYEKGLDQPDTYFNILQKSNLPDELKKGWGAVLEQQDTTADPEGTIRIGDNLTTPRRMVQDFMKIRELMVEGRGLLERTGTQKEIAAEDRKHQKELARIKKGDTNLKTKRIDALTREINDLVEKKAEMQADPTQPTQAVLTLTKRINLLEQRLSDFKGEKTGKTGMPLEGLKKFDR